MHTSTGPSASAPMLVIVEPTEDPTESPRAASASATPTNETALHGDYRLRTHSHSWSQGSDMRIGDLPRAIVDSTALPPALNVLPHSHSSHSNSGFSLFSSSSLPPLGVGDATDSESEPLKGHPVTRMQHVLGCIVLLLVGALVWIALTPDHIEPTQSPAVRTHGRSPLLTMMLHARNSANTDIASKATVPIITPAVAAMVAPTISHLPAALRGDNSASKPHFLGGLLPHSDLVDSDLRCPSSDRVHQSVCDFSWGPHRGGTADHTRADLDPSSSWKKPQDLYTFQAGMHMTGEGPGALVRIVMRDLCCRDELENMPLAYFRVTAHGAAQAAANPPLALGPMPTALGRGHQAVHAAQPAWSGDVHLRNIDESRVLQTFLLLPDPGHYEIQVRLMHYNVSADMVSETYAMNSKEYDNRPGLFVDALVRNARGENGTHLFVHDAASQHSRVYTERARGILPLCGMEGGGRVGGVSHTGTKVGLPLAGRWVYKHREGEDPLQDLTHLDRTFLVEHSEWQPYFCSLDRDASFASALEKARWVHFTGDSNTRHMMFHVCKRANGTLLSVNSAIIPKQWDPPHLCMGPSSVDDRPDSETGLVVGSSARWVLTYTNWFWGKLQTLSPDFSFASQCDQFVERNAGDGVFRGWPHCTKVPDSIRQLAGPGATYFGWGSHAAEMAASEATRAYFATEDAFRLPHFYKTPTLFPLTTANAPHLIPDKFGRQQSMRNNERVHASNLLLVDAVLEERLKYATRTPGGASAHANSIPLLDLFSPTHAAYAELAGDAVHFEEFFSAEMTRLFIHFVGHATNYGPPTTLVSTPPAAAAAAAAPIASAAR